MSIQTRAASTAIGAILGVTALLVLAPLVLPVHAQDDQAEPALKLPEDVAAQAKEDVDAQPGESPGNANYTIEEWRVGSGYDRINVHRENGIDESYENRKAGSMMGNEEKELGDMPNMRRWTIGSW